MGTFYDVDLRNAMLREFAFGVPWYQMPLIACLKLGGFQFPGTTDDPPIESLAPFEVDAADLPEDIRDRMQPLRHELAALGFHEPIYHAIEYPRHATRTYWATLLHASGTAWARIHCRIWSGEGKDKVFLFPMFFTLQSDDTFLVTSAGKPDMLMPESVRMVNQIGATATELWERHQRELDEDLPAHAVRLGGHDHLRPVLEEHHARLRDYNLQRGVFKPLSAEQADVEPVEASAAAAVTPEDAAVLAELERMLNQRSSWISTLLILGVSLGLFVGAFGLGGGWGWEMLWVLIPVLLFHELGHYLAMRWFGYRNVRMFFIPFLGAAVSGRHYNVAGWKKAVVALMGPVPGIILGGAIGIVGLVLRNREVEGAALMMLILNGLNLLPVLPLDGGWVVHAVLFVRHPLLDVTFRTLAILALLGLAIVSRDRILIGLSVVMLLGILASWRIARIAHRLRQRGLAAASLDGQSIPPEAALPILAELRASLPKQTPPKVLATYTTSVFETLNARPPGILASLALIAMQGVSLLAALVLAVILSVAQFGNFGELIDLVASRPKNYFEPGATGAWRGPEAPALPTDARVTIAGTFGRQAAAKSAFDALQAELPPMATLRWFGQSVFVTLPGGKKEDVTRWTNRLREQGAEVLTERTNASADASLACIAPNLNAAQELEAELGEYLRAPNCNLLLPPWSAAWQALPADEQMRYRKARRTVWRLQDTHAKAAAHPDVRALQERAGAILRGGDPQAFQKHFRDIAEVIEREQRRLEEEIRSEGEENVDQVVLAQWQKLNQPRKRALDFVDPPPPNEGDPAKKPAEPPDEQALRARFEAQERERSELLREMAKRMGRLPLVDDKVDPASELDTVITGGIRRQGLYLAIDYVAFRHTAEGLPALAEWLSRRGCVDIYYGIFGNFGDDEAGDPQP